MHAWRCDPIPLLIPQDEFTALEAGLAQRARLLEAILQDIYGKQTLLADGTLPPALVFPNPGFLRPCCGLPPRHLLQLYAADLVRGPDGAWRVLADRTAAAGGLGYARENRRLLGRVLPEAFRTMQVRLLRPFFDVWQDALQRLAPPDPSGRPKANPAVALLTPGTANPQWFEHMYLSRELSCALVEGGDLTVRGGAVFLKTLKGLQQVDVLLRRMDGRMIDPLELEAGSLIGVPGLIDAARGGTVRIANDPGSGVVEAPALAAFLPALCLRLLGERLLTDSVPTLWLGEERARVMVQQDPARWLVRPALDGTVHALAPAVMEPSARQALMARVAARPWEWAASAAVPPSVAPCLTAGGLEPKPVVLRLFLVWDGAGWRAMPGGLARVMEPSGSTAGRPSQAAISKDVWVLTEDRSDIVGPAALIVPPVRLRRATGDLPSRVADNLFWLGRYVERLERAARLVRAAVARLGRGTAVMPHEVTELQALGRCLAEAGVIPPEAAGTAATTTMAEALLSAGRDAGSIGVMFAQVARLTESVRDRLTGDMYATFTQTLRAARADAAAVDRSLDGLSHAMVGIMRFSAAVAGVAAENMVRGGGWMFLDLGRRIERGQAVACEVAFALDQPPQRIDGGLRLVLELCDSAITYRSRYLNVLQPAPVLDLVLADQGNPRGLAFQLAQTHALLDELNGESGARALLAGAAAGLLAEVEALVAGVLAAADQAEAAAALPQRLPAIAAGIAALSDRITRRYFALLPAVQTLGLSGDSGELRGAA
nr:circularly permuted type 2 ATP-grasp protein [Limobrevibacterium gyesilva]